MERQVGGEEGMGEGRATHTHSDALYSEKNDVLIFFL